MAGDVKNQATCKVGAHLQEGEVLLMQFKPCVASATMFRHLVSVGIKQTSKKRGTDEG